MPKLTSATVEDLLAHASTALAVATNFGSVLPIPLVSSLIGSAQVIIQTAQSVRQSRVAYAELADRVSELVLIIREQVHETIEPINPRLQNALESLEKVFQRIERFVLEQDQMTFLHRIARRASIEADVRKFTAELDYAIKVFQTGSQIRTELQLGAQAQTLIAIDTRGNHERKYDDDGEFRLYRLCDVQLIRPLSFLPATIATGSATPYRVPIGDYYEAEIKGRAVVVDTIADLSVLKRSFHPNVAQLEGYSYGSSTQFYVIKGALMPLSAYLASDFLLDSGRRMYHALSDIYWGNCFLVSLGFASTVQTEGIMVDIQRHCAIIGADGEFYLTDYANRFYDYIAFHLSDFNQFQQSFLDVLTADGQMSYSLREVVNLWSKQGASMCISHEIRSCAGSSLSGLLYTHPSVIMVESPSPGQCKFVTFMEDEVFPVTVGWPPVLWKRNQEESVQNDVWDTWDDSLGESMDCGTEIVSNKHDVWINRGMVEKYLLEHVLPISKRMGADITDVCAVQYQSFEFVAMNLCTSTTHSPVFLHANPMDPETNQIPTPWAYFSFSPDPCTDATERENLMRRDDDSRPCATDHYASTLPGVDAYAYVEVVYTYYRLTNLQAKFLSFLHAAFGQQEDEDREEENTQERFAETMKSRSSSSER